MADRYSVIFVCAGNTCRSPMAKYIMRHLLDEAGLIDKVYVDSAGCSTRGGGGLSKGSRIQLTANHMPFDFHVSKAFTKELYQKFDAVIALDEYILQSAKKKCGGDLDKKIRLFKDLDGAAIGVDDPLYTGDYPKAYADIFSGCESLLKELKDELNQTK